MNKAIRILLAVFATYRISSMLTAEEGPYSVFDRLRAKLGAYDYAQNGLPNTNLGRGITCPLCTGVYVSLALLVCIFLPSSVGDLFLAWMGVSGGQVFLENLTSDESIEGAIQEVADSLEDQT